jgi:hypothetical protein
VKDDRTDEAKLLNMTRDQESSFWEAYMLATLNPWWDTAIEQHESGDDTLMEGIKERAMRDTCKGLNISFESGIKIIDQILSDPKDIADK